MIIEIVSTGEKSPWFEARVDWGAGDDFVVIGGPDPKRVCFNASRVLRTLGERFEILAQAEDVLDLNSQMEANLGLTPMSAMKGGKS